MAEIHKLTNNGQTIWPGTSTTAVIDPVTEKSLADLLQYILPVKTEINADTKIIKVGSPTEISYTWRTEFAGKDITSECSYTLNGEEIEGSSYTETITPEYAGEEKRTLKTIYKGKEYETEINLFSIQPTYFGSVSNLEEISSETVQGLEEILIGEEDFPVTVKGIDLDIERFVFAYPSFLGDLNSIKDQNGFESYGYEGCSFEMSVIEIDDILYNVYYMKDLCSVDNFKFIFS